MATLKVNEIDLPPEITKKDLEYPKWDDTDKHVYDKDFELWYTESFGWCIPTLMISHNRRTSTGDRTYATSLDGKGCRIGKGPHVKAMVKVYFRESRADKLQKFIDIRDAGAEQANSIRDRISSRRMQGQIHRAAGHTSWRW